MIYILDATFGGCVGIHLKVVHLDPFDIWVVFHSFKEIHCELP